MKKKLKITYMPGAFDNFEGSQEELDAFIKDLEDKIHNEDFFEHSRPVDLDQLQKDDPLLAEELAKILDNTDRERKLN